MTEDAERQDLAAYALGVLEDADRVRVEAHVQNCPDCASELSEYRAVISMLPPARDSEQAPGEAWEAVAARIRGRDETKPRGVAGAGWLGRWMGGARVFQPALSAILAAVAIGLIAWNASLQVQLSHRQTTITTPETASGEITVELTGPSVTSGLGGHLFMSGDRQKGGLVVAGLPVLPSGRSYEIWFIRADQGRAPAGTFSVDSFGQAVAKVAVPQPGTEFSGVSITEEPDGGSPTPTGHDLLAGPIYE